MSSYDYTVNAEIHPLLMLYHLLAKGCETLISYPAFILLTQMQTDVNICIFSIYFHLLFWLLTQEFGILKNVIYVNENQGSMLILIRELDEQVLDVLD